MHDPDEFLLRLLEWLPLVAVVVLILVLFDVWSIG